MAASIVKVVPSVSRLIRSIPIARSLLNEYTKLLCKTGSVHFHSSERRYDLMEFFDDPKNWGANEVKSGRSWTKDELRLKSNVDLHKLWYVLLKERNMLLTMEHASNEECELFPNPERIDKVKDSMTRLEEVIRERNEAYWLLEVGESAPKKRQEEVLDPNDVLAHKRKAAEAVTQVDDYISLKFKYALKEQERTLKRRLLNRQRSEVVGLLKRFPNIDMETLKSKYPDVDVEKLKSNKKTRGHHEFNTA